MQPEFLAFLLSIKVLDPLVRSQVSASALGWSSPPKHGLKINVDAVVGPSFFVIAAVTRDWRGNVVFAGSRKVNTIIPLQVEAQAMRWALSLVSDLRCDFVSLEIDSQVLAKLISNSTTPPPWRIKFLCSDLRSFLSSYSNVAVRWVPKIQGSQYHIDISRIGRYVYQYRNINVSYWFKYRPYWSCTGQFRAIQAG